MIRTEQCAGIAGIWGLVAIVRREMFSHLSYYKGYRIQTAGSGMARQCERTL